MIQLTREELHRRVWAQPMTKVAAAVATEALMAVMTGLLECGLELVAGADAEHRLPELATLCSDLARLSASAVRLQELGRD
jgi:hypothetical protein